MQEQGFGLGSQDYKLLLRNRNSWDPKSAFISELKHTLTAAALQTAA